MPPLITISGSEPPMLKTKLEDISIVDNSMIYPDYKIFSQQGYTVGIARAQINDLISNKMDVASHVAQELKDCDTDIKIFLSEGWMGMDHRKKISLPGGVKRNWPYTLIINTVMIACIANNAYWIPSASLNATAELLRLWNNDVFQRPEHVSLKIRPRPVDTSFEFTLDEDELAQNDKIHWLAQMPGLAFGQKRATSLMESSNGILMAAFIKTREELESVPGIGKDIANKIRTFWDK